MIQLASDPNASRNAWRPSGYAGATPKAGNLRRGAHAWPFLSRAALRPPLQEQPPKARTDSGS